MVKRSSVTRCVIALFVLSAPIVFAGSVLSQIEDVQMLLEKTDFMPQEKIRLYFTAPEGTPAGARIALVPSKLPHEEDAVNTQADVAAATIESQTIGGMTEGILIFTAPDAPGMYDFRMYEVIGGLYETGSMSFFVVAP
jgi:hypothetical protein